MKTREAANGTQRTFASQSYEQNISPHELAKSTGIHEAKIIDITNQLLGIDKETAMGLATYFGNSAEYWINLQESFDQANKRRSYVLSDVLATG